MYSREIPDDDAAKLRTMLNMSEIPGTVVDRYWRVKRCLDRSNAGMNDWILAVIVGWDEVTPPGAPEVPELDWNEIERESEVLVYWRNKDRPAKFKGLAQDGDLYVQITGEAEVRAVSRRKVTLQTPALA